MRDLASQLSYSGLQTLSTREYPIPCPLSSQHQHHCWVLDPTLVKFHCFDTTLTSHMLTSNPPARGLPQPLRLYFPTTYSITQTLPPRHPPRCHPFPQTPAEYIGPDTVHNSQKNSNFSSGLHSLFYNLKRRLWLYQRSG